MDLNKVDNIRFEGIDYDDYPDYVDAFIVSADYDGKPMNDKKLDLLNEESWDWKYERLLRFLH